MSMVRGGHRRYVGELESDALLDGLEAGLKRAFPRATEREIDAGRAVAERYAAAVLEAYALAESRDAAAEMISRRREARRG
jgi:hypothetical protein